MSKPILLMSIDGKQPSLATGQVELEQVIYSPANKDKNGIKRYQN